MHETPKNRAVLGRLMRAFIRAGWNPPSSSNSIAEQILEEIDDGGDSVEAHIATDPALGLSAQQRVALTLTAVGMSGPEAAEVMDISHETVRSHLKQARSRLGACTLAHAVAIALNEGIIDLPEEELRKTLAA